MKLFIRLFLTVCFVFGFAGNSFGQISNGCFELMSDPCQLSYDPCTYEDFNRPAMWVSENYVAIHSSFNAPATAGNFYDEWADWSIPDTNSILYPFEGQYYVLLSTGDRDTSFGEMSQIINFEPNQTLECHCFFGTMDYITNVEAAMYNDFAEIRLTSSVDINKIKTLFHIDVNMVDSHKSTDGWIKFGYVFDANDKADYDTLTFYITDEPSSDHVFTSYFAIDGLKLGFKPELGDLNDDWMVDFQDFAILGQHWNQDSNDPNLLGWADFDDTNSVDVNDLMIFSSYWLDGEPNICPH